MKQCRKCLADKDVDDFARNVSMPDGLQKWCRGCASKYNAARYQRTGAGSWRERVAAGNRRSRARRRQWLYDYLTSHPCVDCGEPDPVVLEFDHVLGDKSGDVSRFIMSASWTRVLTEISKCVIRCANCHRRRTAKQFGWYSEVIRFEESADLAQR